MNRFGFLFGPVFAVDHRQTAGFRNPDNAVHASMVQVVNAFATNKPSRPKEHTLGTEHAYHFSLFVVDTDANKLREIRVGGRSHGVCEDPVVQLHETDIRTNARKQD